MDLQTKLIAHGLFCCIIRAIFIFHHVHTTLKAGLLMNDVGERQKKHMPFIEVWEIQMFLAIFFSELLIMSGN